MRYVQFVALGALVLSAFSLPVLAKRVRIHSVFGWMLASAFFGLFFRPLYMLGFNSDRRAQEEMFWRDVPIEDFYLPATFLALAALIYSLSYLSGLGGSARLKTLEKLVGGEKQLASAAGLLSVAGLAAAVMYVQATGGLDLSSLSTKRVVASQANSEEGLASLGPILAIGRAGLIGSVTSYHLRKSARQPVRLSSALILGNMFLPFYASDRTGVLLLVLQLMALASFRDTKISRRTVVIGLISLVLLFQVLSTLRTTGRSDTEFALEGPVATADVLVFNRSFFDLSKNLHVIRATGSELELKYGATFTAAIIAPIPRSLWQGKPIISVGPEIGRSVYDLPVTGVPPGLFGEAFWNFKIAGLLGVAVPFGWLCGRVDSIRPRELSAFAQSVFCVLLLPVAYNAVASSFSGVMLDLLRDGFAFFVIWQLHNIQLRLAGR